MTVIAHNFISCSELFLYYPSLSCRKRNKQMKFLYYKTWKCFSDIFLPFYWQLEIKWEALGQISRTNIWVWVVPKMYSLNCLMVGYLRCLPKVRKRKSHSRPVLTRRFLVVSCRALFALRETNFWAPGGIRLSLSLGFSSCFHAAAHWTLYFHVWWWILEMWMSEEGCPSIVFTIGRDSLISIFLPCSEHLPLDGRIGCNLWNETLPRDTTSLPENVVLLRDSWHKQ